MKKHGKKILSGFTLIELTVAIAIVTVLATAGLAAYTGYLKNVRDTTRISDIALMNSIVLDNIRLQGTIPTSIPEFTTLITTANNGQPIVDPLDKKVACLTSATDNTQDYCGYIYNTCDDGAGYVISAKFETTYQTQRYTQISNEAAWYYHLGRCTALDLPPAASIPPPVACRTKADCELNSVCVGPPPKHCREKNLQSIGSECDVDDDCDSNNCNVNAHKCKN
ncbi:MAG: prepilin-type N-terminal cleavage/methylation domain-containing protein [Candidatus Gracilibacteria bacterium]